MLTNIELDENIIDQFEDAFSASGGRMFGTESLFSVRMFGRVGTRPQVSLQGLGPPFGFFLTCVFSLAL